MLEFKNMSFQQNRILLDIFI